MVGGGGCVGTGVIVAVVEGVGETAGVTIEVAGSVEMVTVAEGCSVGEAVGETDGARLKNVPASARDIDRLPNTRVIDSRAASIPIVPWLITLGLTSHLPRALIPGGQ